MAENGNDERMKAVGELLAWQAKRLRIDFTFKVVTHSELTRELLGFSPHEILFTVSFCKFKIIRQAWSFLLLNLIAKWMQSILSQE